MKCAAIMTADPVTVRTTDSIAQAAEVLLSQRLLSIPVVDGNGRYVGMFGANDLASVIVPRIAIAGSLVSNVRFIGDDEKALTARFRELKAQPVQQVADRNAVVLDPDTPQLEAFRIFCRSRMPLPVVDPASRKLLGVVSWWDLVKALTADE